MSPKLPPKWVECHIGDVAKVVGGGTPPSKDPTNFTTQGGIPWITPADLSGYKDAYISKGVRNLSEKGYLICSTVKMPAGSVLFSSRAPVGYVAIASTEVTTNQGFKSFVLPESIDSRFVYYYLRHIKPIAEMMATGTTFKELSGSAAAKLPFVLAPLNEQRRIADKLDTLLARVDACRERLDRMPQILKHFRQAVLAASTSGALTEDCASEKRWTTRKLGTLLTDVKYGTAKKSAYDAKNGTPVIRIPNIINGRVDTTDLKYGHFDKKELKTLSLEKGDLLIIRSNGSLELVGKAAVVESEVQGYLFAGYLIRLRVQTKLIDTRFLYYCLSSPAIRQHIVLTARSTPGVNNINSEEIRSIEINLPPIEEQHEIVRRIERLFAFADLLEARYTAGREQIDQLTPSLLDKAFRGELVPQDPNDETANELLKRIKEQATIMPEQKRKPRINTTKKERHMNKKAVTTLNDLVSALDQLGGDATADRLIIESGLSDDIDRFFELLREGRNTLLYVPVGSNKPIRRIVDANQ
ncbi:MAG: restriction endonuclease subunit S [Syntrophales bacterium]|nr:restriction endonuclease subunit S [Syntrophales bacterium]